MTSRVETKGNAVSVSGLSYSFDGGVSNILDNIDLDIKAGQFWTLLGSSGSGKTTILRLIAGLLRASGGIIRIGSRDITHVPPQQRDIGFVFQNYALFPHYTVRRNLEFPLRIRKVPRERIDQLVQEALELVSLERFADTLPANLSGGQQQRVAVARALIFQPSVMLLDEPLGALDRRLRQQLGRNLRDIQLRTGITAIYVTHDQEEAFALSDGVILLDNGKVQQSGTPHDLYYRPANRFVASFLGESNVWEGEVSRVDRDHAWVRTRGREIACSYSGDVKVGDVGCCSLRPEDISLLSKENEAARGSGAVEVLRAKVKHKTYLGGRAILECEADGLDLVVETSARLAEVQIGESYDFSWRAGDPFLTRP